MMSTREGCIMFQVLRLPSAELSLEGKGIIQRGSQPQNQ